MSNQFPSEIKEKRCTCPWCKHASRVRGVIRRGEKGEMRAMIRGLNENLVNLSEELDMAEAYIAELTEHDNGHEKQETIQ